MSLLIRIFALALALSVVAPHCVYAAVIPAERLPPGGMFTAGILGGVPTDYEPFCDVTRNIPGTSETAVADGQTDDSAAINEALALCPAHHCVVLPAGDYRLYSTLVFPKRPVVLRGAGSQPGQIRTRLLSYAPGPAINMNGKPIFKGWLDHIVAGCTAGSRALTFSSGHEISGVVSGDVLLIAENDEDDEPVPAGGRLEIATLVGPHYQWTKSTSFASTYYCERTGGGDPELSPSRVKQVSATLHRGSPSILAPSAGFPLAQGEWIWGNRDSLHFNTLYVRLDGDRDPAALPLPEDGMPKGGLYYSAGISWGGIALNAHGPYIHRAQGFKVVSRQGAVLMLDRPFYCTMTGRRITARVYRSLGTGMGLENLSVEIMNAVPSADAVLVQGVTNSWVKGIEVYRAARNFIVATNTIDCEFRENYVHEPQDPQSGSGYGIRMLGWNFNNLIEDNIAWSCRHSYVLDGINAGHVIGYNFSLDPNDGTDYLYQDFLTHGSYPMFCLYEGNVGARAYCDFVHGGAGHLVYYRNYFRLQEGHIRRYAPYKGAAAVDFDCWNDFMSVVGNVLGYSAIQSDQQGLMAYEGHNRVIYRLGYDADDEAEIVSDDRPKATLLRHGNYDFVHRTIVWDPTIADHQLPQSCYLTGKPAWFGSLAWPPIDPEHPNVDPCIPAWRRFLSYHPELKSLEPTAGAAQGANLP